MLFLHSINYALEQAPTTDVLWFYLKLGFAHILPDGFDHILFIVGLCLLNNRLKPLILQATAFTVAHTVTLILSMKNIIIMPVEIIEPIIALSIAFVALENILSTELKPWRILLVFGFGLIHGLGFASALGELGLPRDTFYTSLIIFNVGVELGQLSIILFLWFALIKPFGGKPFFRPWVVYPVSAAIALMALYWTFERIA